MCSAVGNSKICEPHGAPPLSHLRTWITRLRRNVIVEAVVVFQVVNAPETWQSEIKPCISCRRATKCPPRIVGLSINILEAKRSRSALRTHECLMNRTLRCTTPSGYALRTYLARLFASIRVNSKFEALAVNIIGQCGDA